MRHTPKRMAAAAVVAAMMIVFAIAGAVIGGLLFGWDGALICACIGAGLVIVVALAVG
jgi:hypothetical protein